MAETLDPLYSYLQVFSHGFPFEHGINTVLQFIKSCLEVPHVLFNLI